MVRWAAGWCGGRQDGAVDPLLVLLDARVADAADAWLSDPRDPGVYARLIAAVEDRRVHLRPGTPATEAVPEPTADGGPAPDVPDPADPAAEPTRTDEQDPGVDHEPAATASVRPVGAGLVGDDPRVLLDRLRRGLG
jgi:hypothetical protein